MNLRSIKVRILSLSVVSILATVAALFTYSVRSSNETNRQVTDAVSTIVDAKSKEALSTLASTQAGTVQLEIEAAFDAARNMAATMEVVAAPSSTVPSKQRRTFLNGMLLAVLKDNERFNGTYSAWEPDALDGNDAAYVGGAAVGSDDTGRALPYWTRDAAGKIALQPLVEYDSADLHPNGLVKGGWFLSPQKTGQENILAPLPYIVQGKAVFLATMSVPVHVGDRFLGVVGADFDLSFVQKLAETVDAGIYEGKGSVSIVTPAGLVVAASADPSAIGGSIDKVDPNWSDHAAGRDSTRTTVLDDGAEIVAVAPIRLGRTGEHWSVLITVPRAVVMNDLTLLGGKLERLAGDAAFWLMVVAAAVALVGAAVMWLVSRSVANPIVRLTTAMEGIAARKTGIVVPGTARRDEIGAMARTVGVIQENAVEDAAKTADENRDREARAAAERKAAMIAIADGFERTVGGIIGSVSDASGHLQKAAETLTATADDASHRSATVAEASEAAAANVNTVATASEELATSVLEISRQMDESARISASAVTEAAGTAATVRELADAAQRIGEISDLIGNVAAQTNLLALNATIEAARAGEAGRGFAVVAAEVKGLADQTAKAAAQISTQIAGIQDSTHSAVNAIGSISKTIETMNGIASVIASAVEEQAATTREIAGNITQASTGTTEVTRNIGSVRAAVVKTSSAAGEVLGNSAQLAEQSAALSREVRSFLATVRGS